MKIMQKSHVSAMCLLIVCLSILAVCTANAKADSTALIDTGYQPGLVSCGLGSTVGWEFTPTCDVWVTQLGFFDMDQNGLNLSHKVGIWDINEELLVSATVPSGVAGTLLGEYRYASVTSTLLSGGQTYIIGATTPIPLMVPAFEPDPYPDSNVQIDPLEIVFDPRITLIAANRYAQSNTGDMFTLYFPDAYMPTENFTDPLTGQEVTVEYYFLAPNFAFVPEPSTLMLFTLGVIGILRRSGRRCISGQSGF